MPPYRFLIPLLLLAGCGNDYSANTYATRAVQQVDPVQQGVIVGSREVAISADGTAGAAVGAAAGGIVGSATPGSGLTSALAGVGGGLVGGLIGTGAERALNDNRGTEYIVRQNDGKLVRVTQRDVPPLPIGQKVLVIAGAQARLVADYTVPNVPGASASGAEASRPGAGTPAPLQAPVRADPPSAGPTPSEPPPGTPQPPVGSPSRTDLPPAAPAGTEAPPSPRTPLVPPEAPLAL